MANKKALPRGVRNNNPGNIEWGDPWQGLVPKSERTDQRFCQFTTAAMGIRALATTIITYYDHRTAADGSKIDTPREIVERWAPAFENDVTAYARQIGLALCDTAKDPENFVLNLHDYKQLRAVVEAIIRHENGQGPLKTENTWYDDATIASGLRLAGVVPPIAEVPKTGVPITKETVGATVAAGTGIGQLVEVLPAVAHALNQSEDNLTSGDWSRVAFGVITICISVFITWSQYQKHQKGTIG